MRCLINLKATNKISIKTKNNDDDNNNDNNNNNNNHNNNNDIDIMMMVMMIMMIMIIMMQMMMMMMMMITIMIIPLIGSILHSFINSLSCVYSRAFFMMTQLGVFNKCPRPHLCTVNVCPTNSLLTSVNIAFPFQIITGKEAVWSFPIQQAYDSHESRYKAAICNQEADFTARADKNIALVRTNYGQEKYIRKLDLAWWIHIVIRIRLLTPCPIWLLFWAFNTICYKAHTVFDLGVWFPLCRLLLCFVFYSWCWPYYPAVGYLSGIGEIVLLQYFEIMSGDWMP